MASNYIQSSTCEDRTDILSEIPARPLSTGSFDQTEHLYVNHFTCSLSADIPLYQYDVSIEEIGIKDNDWHEIKSRIRCESIMQLFISNNQLDPNVFVWYDGQKCLYSTSKITPHIRLSKDDRNRLNIKSLVDTNQWSTNDILNYINGQTKKYPYDVVRIIETLLKKSIPDRIEVIKNKCYFKNDKIQKLDNGFEKRQGFIQSLHLSSQRLTISLLTKSTIFYPNISLLDFIHKQIGSNRIPTKYECEKLNKILENCLIVTKQSDWKTTYEFDQFDTRRPEEISIKDKTLIEYYSTDLGIPLTQTTYPCIQVYRLNNYNDPCHLPLELCRIKECQVYDKQLPMTHDDGKGIPTPEARYNTIMDTLRECDYNSQSNLLCQIIGFHINDGEMLELDAGIVTPPEIVSSPRHPAPIKNGRIKLDGELYRPIPISNLAVRYFGIESNNDKQIAKRFTEKLIEIMKNFNMYKNHTEDDIKEANFEAINEHFRIMKKQKVSFIICIMNAQSEDNLTRLKCHIKKCGTRKHGIITQCSILSEIPSDNLVKDYCENLIRKINFKNGGINIKVNLDIALKDRISEMDSIMFVGADVIHPTNVTRHHPSIAAMVASGNPSCSLTDARVCKQYPKEGKCSIETIVGMTEMMEQLLDYNKETSGRLPTKIVFYRDGVDDGQFGKILKQEIPAIRKAFTSKYKTQQHPSLTFIVVKKRHNTRFFTYNPNTDQHSPRSRKLPKETDNMSIGAVIDTTIVHPYQNNFYLNSHDAYQGVNHPPLYHILLNEIGFTTKELQLLTHHLCFADPRSSASEAIPSVVHQADIAAFNARDLFFDDDESSTTTSSSNYFDYEILKVHPDLKNLPVLS